MKEYLIFLVHTVKVFGMVADIGHYAVLILMTSIIAGTL
ncbi:hypothetical protein JCM19240_6303 [Vibrio maritimus]|uniref:Uncharacterized protein n=1 Tax=Vibrio maritimus TaxID=990268 RepID=A0A090SYW9_9VIBR|nr:hypothetical protein JCM19240_6303 [Vibrio maritimus]